MLKIIKSLALIAVVMAVVVGGTYAYFTSNQVSNANTLATGTLKVSANDNGAGGAFNIDLGQLRNMAPGDKSGEAKITVKNEGTLNAATFGRFTLSGDQMLASALKFYDYKVEYFDANNNPKARWGGGNDPYYGDTSNQDWFIRGGDDSRWTAVGGSSLLSSWVSGDGPLDIPRTAWDLEGLKPGESYVITFSFQMDPAADNTYQNKSLGFGYEVRATQVKAPAIFEVLSDPNVSASYAETGILPYLTSQLGA